MIPAPATIKNVWLFLVPDGVLLDMSDEFYIQFLELTRSPRTEVVILTADIAKTIAGFKEKGIKVDEFEHCFKSYDKTDHSLTILATYYRNHQNKKENTVSVSALTNEKLFVIASGVVIFNSNPGNLNLNTCTLTNIDVDFFGVMKKLPDMIRSYLKSLDMKDSVRLDDLHIDQTVMAKLHYYDRMRYLSHMVDVVKGYIVFKRNELRVKTVLKNTIPTQFAVTLSSNTPNIFDCIRQALIPAVANTSFTTESIKLACCTFLDQIDDVRKARLIAQIVCGNRNLPTKIELGSETDVFDKFKYLISLPHDKIQLEYDLFGTQPLYEDAHLLLIFMIYQIPLHVIYLNNAGQLEHFIFTENGKQPVEHNTIDYATKYMAHIVICPGDYKGKGHGSNYYVVEPNKVLNLAVAHLQNNATSSANKDDAAQSPYQKFLAEIETGLDLIIASCKQDILVDHRKKLCDSAYFITIVDDSACDQDSPQHKTYRWCKSNETDRNLELQFLSRDMSREIDVLKPIVLNQFIDSNNIEQTFEGWLHMLTDFNDNVSKELQRFWKDESIRSELATLRT